MRYLRVLYLLLFVSVLWTPVHADRWHYSKVERIVAVGDVHGAYDALTRTLQAADVLDKQLDWSGGKTNLVFTGDLLDRGARSRQVMDLIMRLEKQARRRGGRVHLLLGNHEVMNLNGDLRYVARAEYAAYEDMESSRTRERWFKQYLASQPEDSDPEAVRAVFDTLAPPGYFGHRRAFRQNGKYGKWLLKKPFIVVINDTAFVHGGLPTFVSRHGLEGVNIDLKNDLQFYVQGKDELTDQRILNPIYRFKEVPDVLKGLDDAGKIPRNAVATAQAVIDLGPSPLHSPISPTWYRGTATCSALVEYDVLAGAFAEIDASRVAMGHTTTITRAVQQRSQGRSVEIDTGMLTEAYKGSGNALIIEGDRLSVVNEDGRTDLSPIDHPIRVGHPLLPLDDAEFESLLANGDLTELPVEGETHRLVEVTNGKLAVRARFNEIQDEQGFPDVAAYRLDRMLGLGMVPVTVRREVNGLSGTMQLLPNKQVSEADLAGVRHRIDAPCGLDKQAATMRVFDTLIANPGRDPTTMLYDEDDLLLILVNHDDAFQVRTVWPGHSSSAEFVINDEWRRVLRGLDDDSLRAELGEVLDEPQLEALMQRRDTLLDAPPTYQPEGG